MLGFQSPRIAKEVCLTDFFVYRNPFLFCQCYTTTWLLHEAALWFLSTAVTGLGFPLDLVMKHVHNWTYILASLDYTMKHCALYCSHRLEHGYWDLYARLFFFVRCKSVHVILMIIRANLNCCWWLFILLQHLLHQDAMNDLSTVFSLEFYFVILPVSCCVCVYI